MKIDELLRQTKPDIDLNMPEFNSLKFESQKIASEKYQSKTHLWKPVIGFAVALTVFLGVGSILPSDQSDQVQSEWFPGALNSAVASDNLLSLNPSASQLVVSEDEWLFYEINSTEYPGAFQYWHSGADELIELNPWGVDPNSNQLSDWKIDELGTVYFGPAWQKTLPDLNGDLDSRVQTLYLELIRQANATSKIAEEVEDTFFFGLLSIINSQLATSDLRITAIELWNRVPDTANFKPQEFKRFTIEGQDFYFRNRDRGRFQQFQVIDTSIPGIRQEFTLDCNAAGKVVESSWVQTVTVVDAKLKQPKESDLERLKVFELEAYLEAIGVGEEINPCN
jgi:hypothetical protein